MLLILATVAAATVDGARPWAVVTGASSGIGSALAEELASRGVSVAIVARRRAVLRRRCAELERAHGVECLPVALDLSQPGGATRLERATRRLPRLELAVANAGVPWTGAAVAQPVASLERQLELNVRQLAIMCRLFGARFAAQGGGGLLLTSSLTALAPLPQAAAYGASRAFVASLAGGLRRELAPSGVAVTCLLPGATDTEFAERAGIESAMLFNFPLARALGLVQSATTVARTALDGLAAGEATVVPGFLNGAYRTGAALMPAALGADFSAACFGAASPLASPAALLAALPALLPGVAFLVAAVGVELVRWPVTWLCRPPLPWWPPPPRWPAADGAMSAADWARAVLLLLCGLIALNVWQNGRAARPPPAGVDSAAAVRRLRAKADVVAAWRAAPPPALAAVTERAWDGELLPFGVLAPMSALITHRLFGPGGPWRGKTFSRTTAGFMCFGANRFAPRTAAEAAPERVAQQFVAKIGPSALDGRDALVLDYAAAGTPLWGHALGMRDELRQLAPGVLLGLGSMAATGGARNCAPFLLIERRGAAA